MPVYGETLLPASLSFILGKYNYSGKWMPDVWMHPSDVKEDWIALN